MKACFLNVSTSGIGLSSLIFSHFEKCKYFNSLYSYIIYCINVSEAGRAIQRNWQYRALKTKDWDKKQQHNTEN
jgi:hypothetical protein